MHITYDTLETSQFFDFSNENISEKTFLISNYDDFLSNNLQIDGIDVSFFKYHLIIGLVFFDGSNPKRIVKEILYDAKKESICIKTNLKDITFSTMDYRQHAFFFSIKKEDASSVTQVIFE